LLAFPFVKPTSINDKVLDEINSKSEIIRSLLNKVIPLDIANDKPIGSKIENDNKDKKFDSKPSTKIIKNLKRLLVTTVNNPYDKSTVILKNAGFSGSSGKNIKTYAINKNYIEEHTIHLGKKGNAGKYFELLDKAYRFLDDLYVEYKKQRGKGSFEHRLYQDILYRYFSKKGYRTTIEDSYDQDDSYTLVDISVENSDGERTAYEIEFNINKQIIHNIKKNSEAGYNTIVIVVKKKQKDEINKFIDNNLKQELKGKVKIKSITDFI
jgi:hypothetical protein